MEANIITQSSIRNVLIKKQINLLDINSEKQIYTKLFIGDVLDFVQNANILDTLSKIKSKLLPKGRLVVEGHDLFELSLAVVNDKINSQDYSTIITNRYRLVYLQDMCDILSRSGFNILYKDIDSIRYFIEAENV